MIQVDLCRDSRTWDEYVAADPRATSYHRWRWKDVIEQVFRHRGFYLEATDQHRITGILPLFEINSLLFGHFLLSMPFTSYGGVLASDPESEAQLLSTAIGLARELRADRIELRQLTDAGQEWHSESEKVLMKVTLPKAPEELFARLTPRLRTKIRSAMKQGMSVTWSGAEGIRDFYFVFSRNMRNLGTPVYPVSWFQRYMAATVSESRILTVWEGSEPVATTLIHSFRDTMEMPWIASTPGARRHNSGALLYWTALGWAIANGFRSADLGRCTPGSGTHRFKQQWHCEEVPLNWQVWSRAGAETHSLHADDPRFGFAVAAWKHLPLAIANGIGPRIVRAFA